MPKKYDCSFKEDFKPPIKGREENGSFIKKANKTIKEFGNLPSWEEKFEKLLEWKWFEGKPTEWSLDKEDIEMVKDFIRQERQQAVKDRDSEWVITSMSIIKKARQQAVKEVIGEIEKGLPKHRKVICGHTNNARYITGWNKCLKEAKKLINQLKEKYEKMPRQ